MHSIQQLIDSFPLIEKQIGFTFKDKNLLLLAFVHCSYVNENRMITEHNERLEFLGDAVLGMLIADYLYQTFPDTPEGNLSYLRSRLVEANSCLGYIQKLNLAPYLLLGKGERIHDSRGRASILANFFEALIGAIYLDGGLESAKTFLFSHFSEEIQTIIDTPQCNWKSLLQDYCQKNYQKVPQYRVLQEQGPDHGKVFNIAVYIGEIELGSGKGLSKKIAQQAAAENALSKVSPNASS